MFELLCGLLFGAVGLLWMVVWWYASMVVYVNSIGVIVLLWFGVWFGLGCVCLWLVFVFGLCFVVFGACFVVYWLVNSVVHIRSGVWWFTWLLGVYVCLHVYWYLY